MSFEAAQTNATKSYLATYHQTAAGGWAGQVAAMGVEVEAPTLNDARTALSTAVKQHIEPTINAAPPETPFDEHLPSGIPQTAETVADRMEVHLYGTQTPGQPFITASRESSYQPPGTPHLDPAGAPLPLPSVVMVLDELGSSDLMEDGLSSQQLADRAALLARAREWLGSRDTEQLESTIVYTDNLVHGAPMNDASDTSDRLGFTVSGACHYQLELVLAETAVRGAITVGEHHQSAAIIAGPALIEAHILESKIAKYPRILSQCKRGIRPRS